MSYIMPSLDTNSEEYKNFMKDLGDWYRNSNFTLMMPSTIPRRPVYIWGKQTCCIKFSEVNNPKNWNADNIKPKNMEALHNACTAMHKSRKLRPNVWGKME